MYLLSWIFNSFRRLSFGDFLMTQQKKRNLTSGGNIACPVCFKFIQNHLPWELNHCFEKNPKWYREVFNLP